MRLLFVDFEEKDIPVISPSLDIIYEIKGWEELPTLHDYDVIITDLHNLNDSEIRTASQHRRKFEQQVDSGGLLFIFLAPDKSYRISSRYGFGRFEWIPNSSHFGVVEEPGESVSILKSDFRTLFETVGKDNITWEVYLKKAVKGSGEPKDLLTNRAGYPISLEVFMGEGRVILLPLFSDRKEAIRNIIEKALPQIFPDLEKLRTQELKKIPRPGWVEDYVFTKKKELMEKVELYSKDIQKYTELEALAYSRDIELVRSVALALKELGFQVEITAKKGTVADLDIRIDDKYGAVAEVKGLISPLKIQHLRQLLHYFIDKRDIERVEGIKALFIVNHQMNRKPENRDTVPCTPTALEAAQKHGVAIISTYDLLEALRGVSNREITKEAVRKKIVEAIGYANLASY